MVPAKADSMLHGRARFTLLYPLRTIFNPARVSNACTGSIPGTLNVRPWLTAFLILAIRDDRTTQGATKCARPFFRSWRP
jgi:hypothetical protein